MNKTMIKFFRGSVIAVVSVCLIVFVFLTSFMTSQTKRTVMEISDKYMAEMSRQIKQKFEAIITLRLEQVDGIVKRTPPETESYGRVMLKELQNSAEIRNFSWLGLYAEDGEIEKVYGEDVELNDNSDYLASLQRDGTMVAQGLTASGEKMLLLGVEAAYPMGSGQHSAALIVGLPMEYLSMILFLDEDDTMAYSHIIDVEGNFVVRSADAYRENYFTRIREQYDSFEGKDAEDYAIGMREAIDNRDIYSSVVSMSGQQLHVYCVPLSENTSWYLISAMPNDYMEDSVSRLDTVRTWVMVCSVAAILLVMTVIFVVYYKLSKQQIRELDKAMADAVHANMAKSEFLSSMSHDIRSPMNAIIGMTEIAQRNIDDKNRVVDCLRKVSLSSKHLLGLINDVLDMSKIESGKMTLNESPMSLREVMDDIVNIIQPQVKARYQLFDIYIQKILVENVHCDTVRLNQVLINLLTNAVKFTPEGGRVDVHVFQEPSPKGGGYIRTHFEVVDTGIGMSEEFQKKIWDTFSREETDEVRHIVGAGLGTSITKKIVELMGGTIELRSELGKGSTFHVTLDLRKANDIEMEMQLPEWNILVVDDNEWLCLSAVSNLEELGVHAEWTLDGRDAVRMIEERHNKGEDYRFVLVDWKMPNMDGIETIREIRKRVGRSVPIFLISAYDWNELGEDVAPEIEGFISKPLFKSTLYERLRQYVEGFDASAVEAEEEVDFTGKRILLAEDMDINWEVASEILSVTGMLLERAENGKICVEMFSKSEVGYYDAVLMDIRMPIMNGYDATKAIRSLGRPDNNLPIIAMTADAFSDDAEHCLECGMNAHIPKPLDIEECMRTLQKFLS